MHTAKIRRLRDSTDKWGNILTIRFRLWCYKSESIGKMVFTQYSRTELTHGSSLEAAVDQLMAKLEEEAGRL